MTPEGFQNLIQYFRDACDRYMRNGNRSEAQRCEDAIALARRIETRLRLPSWCKTLGDIEPGCEADPHFDLFTEIIAAHAAELAAENGTLQTS